MGSCDPRVADLSLARFATGLETPVGVVVIVVGNAELFQSGRTAFAPNRRRTHGGEGKRMSSFAALNREEIRQGIVMGAFDISPIFRITPRNRTRQGPTTGQQTRAVGEHGAVFIGAVAQGVSERSASALASGTAVDHGHPAHIAKAVRGFFQTNAGGPVAHHIIEARPRPPSGAARLQIVHGHIIHVDLGELWVVPPHPETGRTPSKSDFGGKDIAVGIENSRNGLGVARAAFQILVGEHDGRDDVLAIGVAFPNVAHFNDPKVEDFSIDGDRLSTGGIAFYRKNHSVLSIGKIGEFKGPSGIGLVEIIRAFQLYQCSYEQGFAVGILHDPDERSLRIHLAGKQTQQEHPKTG